MKAAVTLLLVLITVMTQSIPSDISLGCTGCTEQE